MTVISRILGLVREVVFARYFGASGSTDAFFVAFKIPNFLRRLFAEGSFSLAFVPVLSEYRSKGDREALKSLIDSVAGTLLGILLLVSAIGVFAAPAILMLFAPGWYLDGRESFELAAGMLQVTFPYILLISLTAFAGGILNTFERFLVPAITPALLNISFITATIAFAGFFTPPVKVLAWAVLVAGILQLLLQIPALQRHGLLPRPRWGWSHPGVRKILRLMIPTLIGSSVAQVNLLFDTLIASFLIAGSVSWLNYSDRLLEFPIGVFGVALATVILPSLSQKHAKQSTVEFSATLDWALRLAVIITTPAAAGLVVLSAPLLATLFQYGAYQPDDVMMSSLSLIAYSAGLPAFIAVKILAPGFYARQDTRTPVRIAIIAMATNMLLNVLFVGSLIWIDFNGVHMGLALASSAAAYLNAGMLYKALRRQSVYVPAPGWGRIWSSVGLATFFMAAILIWLSPELQSWLDRDAWQRIIMLAPLVIGGGLAYLAGLYMTGTRANVFKR